MDINYYRRYEPIFGSWRIVRQLGAGSFGTVFEIEREDFGHKYRAALKAITIPQSKSDIDEAMFEGHDRQSASAYYHNFVSALINEVSIMSEFKGESNIVSYEDHCVIPHTDGIGWDILIRMELLTPLLQYASNHALGRSEIIKLGIDICRALELCGKRNIIHRDIKPENIFVSDSGNFKLGDFGIARTVEKDSNGLSKKGTYTYMAPEVYRGQEYGPSVDIYSLGIVLYRFLNNNRAPFMPLYPAPIGYGDREQAMARRINGEAIPKPVNADDALAQVVLKACAFDARDRYASAGEMRRALEAVVSAGGDKTVILDNNDTTILEYGSGSSSVSRSDSSRRNYIPPEPSQSGYSPQQNGGQPSYAPRFDPQTGKPLYQQSGAYAAQQQPQVKFTEEKPRRSKAPIIIAACVVLALIVGGVIMWTNRSGWDSSHTKYYASGEMLTGWQEINGDLYYFDKSSGERLTGWLEMDGKHYYLGDDGAVKKGFVSVGDRTYFFNEDTGERVSGWLNYNESGTWYFCDPNREDALAVGKWIIGEGYYYFFENGRMATGTVHFDEDESTANGDSGTTTYYFDENGLFLYKELHLSGIDTPANSYSSDSRDFYINSTDIWNGHYRELIEAVTECSELTIGVTDAKYYDNCEWVAFIQTNDGWENAGCFEVSDGAGSFDAVFETPVTIYAYKMMPNNIDGADTFECTEDIVSIVYRTSAFGVTNGNS